MMLFDDGDWFEPKRYGYGAGLPTAWQGWVALGLYVLAATFVPIGIAIVVPDMALVGGIVFVLALTAMFMLFVRNHTRGGWRWRRGEKD